jgi:hypothetical protein
LRILWNLLRPSTLLALVLAFSLQPSTHAEIPAPDNVFYGLIIIGTNQVTAANTAFTVEARRADGITVARYRMGSRAEAGNYYVLTVKVEESSPLHDPSAALACEALSIVLKSNGLTQAQIAIPIAGRGRVEQLDFGILPTNAPAGFEVWAATRGLASGSGNQDADGDGVSNFNEYLAGTDPNDSRSKFVLAITQTANDARISFDARQASGPGYENLSRYYSLEKSDVGLGAWTSLFNYTNLAGNGQTMSIAVPRTNGAPQFFRGKVELRRP